MKEIRMVVCGVLATLSGLVMGATANCTIDQPGCYTLFSVRAEDNGAVQSLLANQGVQERQQFGMDLMRLYRAGKASPAVSGSQLYLVWGTTETPVAWSVNDPRKKPVQVTFEDVTGKVPYPETSLGAPTKVYRVKADGIAVGLQFSGAALRTAKILVCAEERGLVYPKDEGGQKRKGLVVTENQFQAILDAGILGGFAPFIFPTVASR